MYLLQSAAAAEVFFDASILWSSHCTLCIALCAFEVCTWDCSCLFMWRITPRNTCTVFRETNPCQMQLLHGLDISNGQNSRFPIFHLNRIQSREWRKRIYFLLAMGWIFEVQMDFGFLCSHLQITLSQFVSVYTDFSHGSTLLDLGQRAA